MVDVFLTILAPVVYVLIFGICTYMVIYFQHPDDNNEAYFPKAIVVLSLSIAISSVLLQPLDNGSRNSPWGGLPMDVIYIEYYVITAVLVFLIIPFAYFFYGAYDPDKKGKAICKGIKYTVVFFVVYAILCIVLYFLLGVADVPVDLCFAELGDFDHIPSAIQPQSITETTQAFQVSFLLFFISIMSILGGILFVIFGGFGLTLLPLDLIQSYRARPIPISEKEYKARKILLGERADELIKEGAGFKNSRPSRRVVNEWRQEVFMLEEEFDLTQAAYKRKFPIFFYWGMLALGIIGIGITITWLIHIFIWKIYKAIPFLNDLFYLLDVGVASFFGTVLYCIWALWLTWAVFIGNFQFGMRIPFLFSIHPMKPEGTLMNAFLFNSGLILLTSVAVVQFLSDSFTLYLRGTASTMIFNLVVGNLRILGYFWKVYTWGVPVAAVLAVIYLFFTRKRRRVRRARDRLAIVNVDRTLKKGTGKRPGDKAVKLDKLPKLGKYK